MHAPHIGQIASILCESCNVFCEHPQILGSAIARRSDESLSNGFTQNTRQLLFPRESGFTYKYAKIRNDHQLFGKDKQKWRVEYGDALYKVYDWGGNLAGYFFPRYTEIQHEDEEDEIIDDLNKNHSAVGEATLLLPMVKLNLLDQHEGMEIDFVISSLETNAERVGNWKKWLHDNAKTFGIAGAAVYTAREDRNMLSIALGIVTMIKLGEKEVKDFLLPLLDKLHEDGFL